MKTYNALSKEFTDEVKTKMGGGEINRCCV